MRRLNWVAIATPTLERERLNFIEFDLCDLWESVEGVLGNE